MIDNAYQSGDSSNCWSAVYAAHGTIQTSDARDKDVLGDPSFAGDLIDLRSRASATRRNQTT